MDKKEKIFIKGLNAKRGEKAPEWIIANVGINMADLIVASNQYAKNGWLNVTLKKSKEGKMYFELDQYEKSPNPNLGEVAKPLVDIQKDRTTSPDENGNVISLDEIPF